MQTPDTEPLKRQLTTTGIWVLAINGFIGAGIFGSPAAVAGFMGPYGALLFLGCGLLMLTVILSFAEISSYFKNTGGPVQYTRRVFGPFVGFQTGWAFYIARLTAFAANVNLLVSTMGFFFEELTGGAARILTLFAIVAFLAWVNVRGAKEAMASVGVLTLLKFIPLMVLVLGGVLYLSPEAVGIGSDHPLPDATTFGAAALLVIYAFVGWEAAVIPAGESKNPVRDMPRALILALITVTVLYTLIQAAGYAILGEGLAQTERPLVEAASAMLGTTGAVILMIGVVVSVGGNVASTMFTTPRLTYAMARDGKLPEFFARVHPIYNTPVGSVVFFSVLVFVLSVYGSFVWLAALSALVRILIYMLCIAAIPSLRKNDTNTDEPRFRLPGGYTIPAIAMIICAWLLLSVSTTSILATLTFLGIGALVYVWMTRTAAAG